MRNLDVTALRSLVAIADTNGVTRAAERVNLTQSAVSMQIKRLEQQTGRELLLKDGRGVVLSRSAERLVSYARQMLAINDEAWSRLVSDECTGELSIGVPPDAVHPHIPLVLRQAKLQLPHMRLTLSSALTRDLKQSFAVGELDLIITTENQLDADGETLTHLGLYWYGARGGTARLQTPLPLALCNHCALRGNVDKALTRARIPWDGVSDTDSEEVVQAIVAADMAITTRLEGGAPPECERIDDPRLPALDPVRINMYAHAEERPEIGVLKDIFRRIYQSDGRRVAVSA